MSDAVLPCTGVQVHYVEGGDSDRCVTCGSDPSEGLCPVPPKGHKFTGDARCGNEGCGHDMPEVVELFARYRADENPSNPVLVDPERIRDEH